MEIRRKNLKNFPYNTHSRVMRFTNIVIHLIYIYYIFTSSRRQAGIHIEIHGMCVV